MLRELSSCKPALASRDLAGIAGAAVVCYMSRMSEMAVWIDGHEARVFHVDAQRFDEATVRSPAHHVHRHPKDQETREHNHPDDEPHFFSAVARSLAGAGAILVLGPSVTKLHFLRYLHKHDPALEQRIVGVETSDHPTDRQIVAHVRSYFLTPPLRVGV